MKTLRTELTGVSGILVTPFDAQGSLAPARLRAIVDRAVAAGVHTLVANGNTSEFYTLTMAEAARMVEVAADHIGGRVPLIGGVGRSVQDACALTRISKDAGAAAIVVHQPPDPFTAPRGVTAYLEEIAAAADGLPLILYLRDDGVGLDAIEAMCRVANVIGVKWATPTPLRLTQAMRRAPAETAWICGLAEPWAPPFYAVGARGFTSGLVNVWPEHSVAIYHALEAENYPRAMELIRAVEKFEKLRAEERSGANVSVVKAALQLTGHDCGAVRPPGAWPLSERQMEDLRQLLLGWQSRLGDHNSKRWGTIGKA